MPELESVEYTRHATERMAERHISREAVEMTLRFGAGRPGRAGKWIYGRAGIGGPGLRVVIVEKDGVARVITVVRFEEARMTSPTLSYDPEANAIYLRFSDEEIAETVELSETVYVDVDAEGNPVGFEVLDANPAWLATMSALPDAAALKDVLKHRAA